ncbi:hypothetical protein JYU34_003315 [Plutella xylostella]|uniref:Uncharacterized protein n=1 Tax=Plutella xylostella TaxID=51655 RepID=A0ABQ7QZR0_PLUXY|nr:hypothetical protein JYU34_003315 [Plutella xylostella]
MVTTQELLEQQRDMERMIGTRMDEFERKLQSSNTPMKPELEDLSRDFIIFKDSVMPILRLMHEQIAGLARHVDEMDSQSRHNALLFTGIKEEKEEDPAALVSHTIVSKLGLTDFNHSAISQCVRIGGVLDPVKPRPILVRFSNPSLRSQVWDSKKHLKASPIVIREFLTRTRQHIFMRARKHFGIRACWTRNGAIFVQLPDSSRVKIVSELELNQLCSKHPAVAPAAPAHKPPGSKPAPKAASSRAVTPTQSSAPKSSGAQPAPTTRSKAAAA